MNGVFQLHPSSVLPPLYLFYIVTSEQKPAKRQIGLFLCYLSILESAGQSLMALKERSSKGTDLRLLRWRKFLPLPLLKGFFFFLIPDVLAARITHLGEEQCNKKLWRVKTIDFKKNYMQSENGSNSSNSTSHSAEWIKGRRVHYIRYWHFEGLGFFQGSCKGVNGTVFSTSAWKSSIWKK